MPSLLLTLTVAVLAALFAAQAVAAPRDELYDAVFFADVEGVKSLLRDLRDGVLRAGHVHVDVNRLESEHERSQLMMCGMHDGEDTALLDAKCTKIAAMLKKAGAKMRHTDKHGWSALHHGSVRGFTQFSRFLATKGNLPLDAQDNEGLSPLMRAAGGGWLETVKMLLELGADLRLKDHRGRSALHFVVQMAVIQESYLPYLRSVLELMPRNALELADEHGRTPLHYALIGKGSLEAAQILLERGADCARPDAFGVTPYHMTSSEQTRALIADYNARRAEEEAAAWAKKEEM